MRAFALALLIATSLAACTLPGAPDDAARLETGAGERARADGAPSTSGEATPPAAAAPSGETPGAPTLPPGTVAPPMSEPLPPDVAPEPASKDASALDRSCRTSADCVVKDVGSCCGAMPACVNQAARPDPAAVKAQCARDGMSSVCGFKEITSCTCVAGTCQDGTEAVAQ